MMEEADAPLAHEITPEELDMAFHMFGARRTPTATLAQRKALIDGLPGLTEDDLVKLDQEDSSCPICLTSFVALLNAEEMAIAMDSPAVAASDLGVTRLVNTCGHLFCRKDISTWILEEHDSCPTCRTAYVTATTEDADSEEEADMSDPATLFRNAGTQLTPQHMVLDERQFNRLARMMAHLPDGLFSPAPVSSELTESLAANASTTGSSSDDRRSSSSRNGYTGMYS